MKRNVLALPSTGETVVLPERQVLTVPEAGAVLGIGRTLAYALARQGRLPTLRLGGRLVVPQARLVDLLTSPDATRVPPTRVRVADEGPTGVTRSEGVLAVRDPSNDDDPADTGSHVRAIPAVMGDGYDEG